MADEPALKQKLRGWQIFFIASSAIIGAGIFSNDGEALEIAGPGGMLLSLSVMAIVAVTVMEGVSEMVQLFPAPNAIVEYIEAFVDPDLALVMGIAYWYTYASIFATQIITAANISAYWHLAQIWQTLAFYVAAPIVILGVNFAGVEWFGWLESVGGFLKVCLVLGSAILMYVIAGKEHNGSETSYINDGFTNDPNYAADHNKAVCYAIPLIAYSFLGVEVVAVTAFEARDLKSLRGSSQIIAYFIFLLYFLCAIGECLNVKWTNTSLPVIYGGVGNNTMTATTASDSTPPSTSMVIIATIQDGLPNLPGFLNACLLFSVLSASNTSLYVASRTLYGLTRKIPISANVFMKVFRSFSIVIPSTGVPAAALVVSAISFFWLPFLQLKGGYAIQALVEIMAVSASVSCLLVWASLCLAFINYDRWLRKCRHDLTGEFAVYERHDKKYRPFTLFAFAQPIPAYIGLLGSLLVVFVFTSSTWWIGQVTFSKIAVAYAAPIVLLAMWLVAKAFNQRWWVPIGNDFSKLSRTLRNLQWLKPEQRTMSPEAPVGVLGSQGVDGNVGSYHHSGRVPAPYVTAQAEILRGRGTNV